MVWLSRMSRSVSGMSCFSDFYLAIYFLQRYFGKLSPLHTNGAIVLLFFLLVIQYPPAIIAHRELNSQMLKLLATLWQFFKGVGIPLAKRAHQCAICCKFVILLQKFPQRNVIFFKYLQNLLLIHFNFMRQFLEGDGTRSHYTLVTK
jgi:hypothetical protein